MKQVLIATIAAMMISTVSAAEIKDGTDFVNNNETVTSKTAVVTDSRDVKWRVEVWFRADIPSGITSGFFFQNKMFNTQQEADVEGYRIAGLSKKEFYNEFIKNLNKEGVTSYKMLDVYDFSSRPVMDPTGFKTVSETKAEEWHVKIWFKADIPSGTIERFFYQDRMFDSQKEAQEEAIRIAALSKADFYQEFKLFMTLTGVTSPDMLFLFGTIQCLATDFPVVSPH